MLVYDALRRPFPATEKYKVGGLLHVRNYKSPRKMRRIISEEDDRPYVFLK